MLTQNSLIPSEMFNLFSYAEWQVTEKLPGRVYWIDPFWNGEKHTNPSRVCFTATTLYLFRPGSRDEGIDYNCNGAKGVFVETPLTLDLMDRLVEFLPDWFDFAWAGWIFKIEKPWLEVKEYDPGLRGRFFVGEYVTDCAREACWSAATWRTPLNRISFEPGPELLYSNRQSRFTGRPLSFWSDGKASGREFFHMDSNYRGTMELSKAASRLISIAIRQKAWQENGKWKQLMMVGHFDVEVIKHESVSGTFTVYSNEKRLERLTTDNGLILYRLANEGAAMGEDGDSWDHYELYDDIELAKKSYDEFSIG